MRDEFNPIIVESMSPVITQFIAVTDVGCFYAYTKVTVELRDPSGIGEIILKSQPEKDVPLIYDFRVFNGSGEKIWSIDNLKLNITAASAAYHYYVICNATDLLENTAEWVKKVNGPIGAYVDSLAKLLKALWGVLCWIGNKIAEGLAIIGQFLLNLFKELIMLPLSGLMTLMQGYLQNAVDIILEYADKIASGTATPGDMLEFSMKLGFNLLVGIGLAFGIALEIIFMILTAATFGIGGIIIILVLPFATYYIITTILNTFAPNSTVDAVSKQAGDWLDAGLAAISSIVIGLLQWLGAPVDYSAVNHILTSIGIVFGGEGLVFTSISTILSPCFPGIMSTIMAVFSMIFTFITLYFIKESQSYPVPRYAILLPAIISVEAGIVGIIFGILALQKTTEPSDKSVGLLGLVLGAISTIISAISLKYGG